jgi:hypothetical protein
MALKQLGRSFERDTLRPLFRRIKKWLRITGAHDRISMLESRVDRLESLFREQAGLHYLRLAEAPDPDEPDHAARRDSA